ncbi:LOW QUALITY PROTEIN: copper-transporting ATPase PAA2, chloroplastic-like [Carica papaya]|uniref:LOW QUALITY PROTEIN: copper-transporting ATPase PAA2, chloroplastic-like n=1 Tax=Carica papaya TaxID=3649 RepID=UPI000B8CA24C|nr:LOW QUALITY PROTEIN: copper-transporting ATPase PAA2, chloroplastic-like [Carica papaya]
MGEGGLGIRSLVELSRALLGKWLWRGLVVEGKLWYWVVGARWGDIGGRGSSSGMARPHRMGLWKGIFMGRAQFLEGIKWKLGRGNIIRFWEDEWLGRGCLMHQFPSGNNLAVRKNVVVKEVFRGVDGRGGWNLNLFRNLNDWGIDEFSKLLQVPAEVHLDTYKDKAVLKFKSDGIFTVKSFYDFLTTKAGAKQGLLIRGGDVLERLASIDYVAIDKTGTLTEGKPSVSAIASFTYENSEILQMAAAVEKTAKHPIARAILRKAEELNLTVPVTRGQLAEPGFGTLAEVDGRLVAVGALDWVNERFQIKGNSSDLMDLQQDVMFQSSKAITSSSKYSKTVIYVGLEGEGIIGAIAISDSLRHDAESTISRLRQKGIKTILLSGDREEAVASIAETLGIGSGFINASLTPQQKSAVISTLQSAGHKVAMVGDGINDAPSLAVADVGIALQTEAQDNAASDAASIILFGNKLSQVVDALDLAQATMAKVYQNLSWAVAYNVVAIPIAAGVLLPQLDFAMTPSLSGGLMALSSIFVVTNSLLLQIDGVGSRRKS